MQRNQWLQKRIVVLGAYPKTSPIMFYSLPWASADTVADLSLLPSISSCRICSAKSWLDGFLAACMENSRVAGLSVWTLAESGTPAETLCTGDVSDDSDKLAAVRGLALEQTTPKEGFKDERSIVYTYRRLILGTSIVIRTSKQLLIVLLSIATQRTCLFSYQAGFRQRRRTPL